MSLDAEHYTFAAFRVIYPMLAKHTSAVLSTTDITISLAIMMMRFDAILSALSCGHLSVQCSTLKKARHERSPDMAGNYNDIQSWHLINIMPHEGEDIGEPALFLVQ